MYLESRVILTPLGSMIAATDGDAIVSLDFADEGTDIPNSDHPLLLSLEKELGEYFAGKRRTFDLPLAPQGTPFQKKSLGDAANHPLRGNDLVCARGRKIRQPQSGPCRGQRQRTQPDQHPHPLPPRHRHGRRAGRIQRRRGEKSVPPRTGTAAKITVKYSKLYKEHPCVSLPYLSACCSPHPSMRANSPSAATTLPDN